MTEQEKRDTQEMLLDLERKNSELWLKEFSKIEQLEEALRLTINSFLDPKEIMSQDEFMRTANYLMYEIIKRHKLLNP